MTVTTLQRFTQDRPCPVCSGYERAPRGRGVRDHGFLSEDGKWAHCTRAEHAQGLDQHSASGTYAHLLDGGCDCGISHGPGRTTSGEQSSKRSRTVRQIYPYRDADGQLRYEVIRYVYDDTGQKTFAQRRPDGAGGWAWSIKGVVRLPYRLPELLQAPMDATVFATEGEDDTDRVRDLDLVATCNSGGAGRFQPELVKWFECRNVVLLADNDDAGRQHVQIAAAMLLPVASSVKILEFPGLPVNGDVSDWLDAGHTADELMELAAHAPEVTPEMLSVETPPGPKAGGSQLQVTTLSDVQPEPVEWVWPKRFPRGKKSVLGGDPGLAKSYLMLDVAARISLGGPWPDGGNAPLGDVLIVTAEDALADTVRPRLDLLGADTDRIHAIGITVREGDKDIALSLGEHLAEIEETVVKYNAVMLILDPLLALMGKQTDSYKTAEVRPVLAQIAAMAERTGCAVVSIIHLNKRSTEGNALYRIMASLDFAAAARSVLVVGKNPNDPKRRVLASAKSNLSAPPDALGYYFTPDGNFAWEPGTIEIEADALLAQGGGSESEAIAQVEEFLTELLADGPVKSKEVSREANEAGVAPRTLHRAKSKLGVTVQRSTEGNRGKGFWEWRWPADPQGCQLPVVDKDGTLTKNGADNAPRTATPSASDKVATDQNHHGTQEVDGNLTGTRSLWEGRSAEEPKSRKVATPHTIGGGGNLTGDAGEDDEELRF